MTEFFAGMGVMAVELCASRLLAPYFSSSQIVWTIIIGTIMIAMALGNIYGGKTADKNPDPAKLYKRILIAAVWIAAIPAVGKYIILAVSGVMILSINTSFLIVASFISCMLIFVFPLFLLGTVTPSLAKYTTQSLSENGKIVGTLGAFNTIGSIIGTFLPTFVTIPKVGTAVTFLIFSGILLLISLAYFFSEKSHKIACIVSIVLFAVFAFLGVRGGFAFWENDLAYEGESVYNYLQVKEDDKQVILATNVLFGVQSIHMKEGGLTGLYYDDALAAPVMAGVTEKTDAKMLVLGMGTGTYATLCERYFPNMKTVGVEIDEKITGLAGEYFNLDEDIPVVTYDGRAYLSGIEKDDLYDVIMVDAYRDITIPFQMSSIEFFKMVKAHLKEDGVLIMNMNMYSKNEDTITDYLSDTVTAVFDEVYTVDVAGSTNRELFASNNADMIKNFEAYSKNVSDAELASFFASELQRFKRYDFSGNKEHILTDDKAAVELLGMEVIDELIGAELGYYKGIFEERGIKGLIDSF